MVSCCFTSNTKACTVGLIMEPCSEYFRSLYELVMNEKAVE